MPKEYRDMVEHGPFGKRRRCRKWGRSRKDAKTVEGDRYKFTEYVSEDAKEYLADRYSNKDYLPKPAAL